MDIVSDPTGGQGLKFFGSITASISHEIKNTLAVMTENAGLLEDLAAMAETGTPLDPERVKKLAGVIIRQLHRTDGIVKNMNRFSHSVDSPVCTIDAWEVFELMILLARRLGQMKGISLNPDCGVAGTSITTAPFLLEQLIWRCLEFSMEAAGQGGELKLTLESVPDGVRYRFRGLQGLSQNADPQLQDSGCKALLQNLGAEIEVLSRPGELVLKVPKKLDGHEPNPAESRGPA
ncbi:MAG: sensor histidine kinase [Planctomycetes bacterium]|nr:sensor histidine kinase [Planctomycetota bacterium]